eukprot:4631075-Prymnesium_polylepis.1
MGRKRADGSFRHRRALEDQRAENLEAAVNLGFTDALFADRSAGTIIHPSKKALMQAIDNETYLGWWGD